MSGIEITQTASGWERDGVAHSTLSDALGEPPQTPQLLTVASWRWLSASVSGIAPIGPDEVRAMAVDVWTRESRRPIDGGSADSAPHATAERSDAPANGWIHDAAIVARSDGSVELMVWAELAIDVWELVDTGRLAYASILASLATESQPVMLHSLALTNMPADPRVGAASVSRTRGVLTPIDGVAGALARAGGVMGAKASAAEPQTDKPAAEPDKGTEAEGATEERAAMSPEEMSAKIEELIAEIAALKEQLSARTEELAQARTQAPAETAEQLVERAIRDGKLRRTDAKRWTQIASASAAALESVRRHIEETPSIYARVTRAESAESRATRGVEISPEDAALQRAIEIAPALAARMKARRARGEV